MTVALTPLGTELAIGDFIAIIDSKTGEIVGIKGGDENRVDLTGVQAFSATCAFLNDGQSVERGEGTDLAGTVSHFFRDARSGIADPVAPAVTRKASYLPHLAGMLARRGYKVEAMINNAIGSKSAVRHSVGQLSNRGSAGQGANSNAIYRARASSGGGDLGDKGTHTIAGGRVFQAITGRGRWVRYNSDVPLVITGAGSFTRLDYVKEEVLANPPKTGAVDPNWAGAVNIGDIVQDGDIQWKLVALNANGMPGNTGVLRPGNPGFDPMGILAYGLDQLNAVKVDIKVVHISNAQADTWNAGSNDATYTGWWKDAKRSEVSYYAAAGINVCLGMSPYMPDMVNGTVVYDLMSNAIDELIAELKVTYPGKVFAGLNSYKFWGVNPPVNKLDRVHLVSSAMRPMAQGVDAALAAGPLP